MRSSDLLRPVIQGFGTASALGAVVLYVSTFGLEAGEAGRSFYGIAFGLTWILAIISMAHRWRTFGASIFTGGLRAQLVGMPPWFGKYYLMSGITVGIHFAVLLLSSSAGVPEIQDGSYVLVRHNVAAQTISRARYFALQGEQARLFAMFLAAFNFSISIYWWFGAGSARPGAPWVKPETES